MTSDFPQPADQEPRWHVKVGKTTQGPLTHDEMRQLVAGRKIGPRTLAWASGLPNWLPCSAIPELAGLVDQQSENSAPGGIARARAGLKGLQDQTVDLIRRRARMRHVLAAGALIGLASAFGIYRAYFYKPPHDGLLSS